jgi:hypothetical protein
MPRLFPAFPQGFGADNEPPEQSPELWRLRKPKEKRWISE